MEKVKLTGTKEDVSLVLDTILSKLIQEVNSLNERIDRLENSFTDLYNTIK